MEEKDYDDFLHAVYLVFGGSYLNHQNAPCSTLDKREQWLVNLLCSQFKRELTEDSSGPHAIENLIELFTQWSKDLDLIYEARLKTLNQPIVQQLASTLLNRIKSCTSCTIIPSGLVKVKHAHNDMKQIEGHHEVVNVAIVLKKKIDTNYVDWIQVNPSSSYNQMCQSLTGVKSNPFLKITGISLLSNLNADWLEMMLGLKTTYPRDGSAYEEWVLYECLIAHLNGDIACSAVPDEDFMQYKNIVDISPAHTWDVVSETLRFLLRHFQGDAYQDVYQRILTNFKTSLLKQTFSIYEKKPSDDLRFLLNEIICDVAQQALDHGREEQKRVALELIDEVKAVIKENFSQSELTIRQCCQLDEVEVSSLSFAPAHMIKHSPRHCGSAMPCLKVDPVFVKPGDEGDIIDYLRQFKQTFIDKTIDFDNFDEIAFLSYCIETLILYLAKTNILKKNCSRFSKDDIFLANTLKELAECYYSCQAQLATCFFSKFSYEPHMYAKHLIAQFFIYAAIAALNFRDRRIGSLLIMYNLSVNISDSVSFLKIIPRLVIKDAAWLQVLSTLQDFFTSSESKSTLFCHKKFEGQQFSFKITNYAEEKDTDVAFALKLLQKYPEMYASFNKEYEDLYRKQFNKKWQKLTYTDDYLPKIYCTLAKVAYLAKMCLTGFSPGRRNTNAIKVKWALITKSSVKEGGEYWKSKVSFHVNDSNFKFNLDIYSLASYSVHCNSVSDKARYQRLLRSSDSNPESQLPSHLSENQIIASQDKKPHTMDQQRYIQLAFLQSEPILKLERLYIMLNQQELDFNSEKDIIFIKQTLFEVCLFSEANDRFCSVLERTVHQNPVLIHKLGLLCVRKALEMQFRLMQHHGIGNILDVTLALLTFYPLQYQEEFIKNLYKIYDLLKIVLMKPPSNLSDETLLYLNGYLIISLQSKPESVETETLSILKALTAVTKYGAKGIHLDTNMLLRVREASFALSDRIEKYLIQNPGLLNDLMWSFSPRWDKTKSWQKSKTSLLFTCNDHDHAVKPLLGCIYYKNQLVVGLPHTITSNAVFKELLGNVSFTAILGSYTVGTSEVQCYLSVDSTPQLRLTVLNQATLLIEELIGDIYQRYIPMKEFFNRQYPRLLCESPNSGEKYRHWHRQNQVLVKDKNRQIIYELNLDTNLLLSLQHNGYVVPWKKIKDSKFKRWLQRMESPEWTELIAQLTSDLSIQIQSLHFPRLGLHFDLRMGQFWCKQVHGYVLAEEQHINTLHGFLNYLILEKKEPNSGHKLTKVIIPHRKMAPEGSFSAKTALARKETPLSPAYFVYDLDRVTGLLKGHNTCATLYLAFLYYLTGSLDDDIDAFNSNGYHLCKENLDICWKDQPFDEIELNIFDQFLSPAMCRDYYMYRISIFLKVVAVLHSSLNLSFLHTDEVTRQNTKRSHKILNKCSEYLPFLLTLYLQFKSSIFAQMKLDPEEEEGVIKLCLSTFKTSLEADALKKLWHSSPMQTLGAYHQLNFEKKKSQVLWSKAKKSYNSHYALFFSKEALTETSFINLFVNSTHLYFFHDVPGVSFLSGFDRILGEKFGLNNFISLYKLAKSSTITGSRYHYILHSMVFRAQDNSERFPAKLFMMLARALLLVMENPSMFPDVPDWFGVDKLYVEMRKRVLSKADVFSAFPSFSWNNRGNYNTEEEAKEAREKAELDDEDQNQQIWSKLNEYDLDNGIPRRILRNRSRFALVYESHIKFRNVEKQKAVRKLYLNAALSDELFQFFLKVLTLCENLKNDSVVGRSINPFTNIPLEVIVNAEERPVIPTTGLVSLEEWEFPEQPLIPINDFFILAPQEVSDKKFPFETHLNNPDNYQREFYKELKDSWLAYHEQMEVSYSWRTNKSLSQLEHALQTKYAQFYEAAQWFWNCVAKQLKERPNSESDHYFALSWYSGQVAHYHKGDILRLLVEPGKLAGYNPRCAENPKVIIQNLLNYVSLQINLGKIVRVLAFIEQYKQIESEDEQYSVLHIIVKSLQEYIDPTSLRYPHWFLFQLENDIILRKNQRILIEDMLKETEKAMYQLNMGEGKSSVILPLLSNNLANGQQILRINVLSALFITMKNFLSQCFSGFIKKRIYTLPFHRDSNISIENLRLILRTVQTCQQDQHILLVTPEHRLCLQLKVRELMLENQEQLGANNTFNWQTYRQRMLPNMELYENVSESDKEKLLKRQDEELQKCLLNQNYINPENIILKVPTRGQASDEMARLKDTMDQTVFSEWSCLKAAYLELLNSSTQESAENSQRLSLLNEIIALPAIDLLDESDEILKHGTELNYTLGERFMFAGGALRWQIPQFFIEAIFSDPEVKKVITDGKADGYTVLNSQYSPQGGVPFIQLLDESYFKTKIKPVLIRKFFIENLPSLLQHGLSEDTPIFDDEAVSSLKEYIAGTLPMKTEKKILTFLEDKSSLKAKLLIAKGWLSHGILFHVLNAKYRVEFGLNLHAPGHRTKLIAIPFKGKDTPSLRSEFSHPDVMLGFTIISYLYEGLDEKQIKESIMRLKSKFGHQVAETHYQSWAKAWIEAQTAGSFLPLMLTSLNHLDLSDELCLKKLHQYLSGNHLAILFYLNQFILQKEAMQYRFKISANAHSLVGYNAALGFSGTDDRKLTMPFQVKSLRSATQEGTNGKLLSVLSQERNSRYYSLHVESTNNFLEQICHYAADQPNCYALIDAGAFVTGKSNFEASLFILGNLPARFQGVLYFSDEGNILTVLTRDNKTIALQDCYLDKQSLFTYLDDIHTRGTDIKLPLNCHAILTVSMNMPKHKLMQSAMRLRQLAEKQSVSLWGTEATTLAIARANQISMDEINSAEVIKWVTQNTIEHIKTDLFPVTIRKIDFEFLKKAEAWLKEATTTLPSLVQHCRVKELFSLEEFYGLTPELQDLADRLDLIKSSKTREFWHEIQKDFASKSVAPTSAFYQKVFNRAEKNQFKEIMETIVKEFAPYLQWGSVHSMLDDEEEKEIEVEIVEERDILIAIEKRKARIEQTWDVQLISDQDFIPIAKKEGIVMPLSLIGSSIQMPPNLKNFTWHPDILMTPNFLYTVESESKQTLDHFLRPVDVVLIRRDVKNRSTIVCLSGREASRIRSECKDLLKKNIILHLQDVDGPTKLPIDSVVSEKEKKLLSIVKLFSGECHYTSAKEIEFIAKRIGRLYPHFFISSKCSIIDSASQKLYEILIKEGYLDSCGIMTPKLLRILDPTKSGGAPSVDLINKCHPHHNFVLQKLRNIYSKLIFDPSSLKENHNTLWQWVGTRGRLKEYMGSILESILVSKDLPLPHPDTERYH